MTQVTEKPSILNLDRNIEVVKKRPKKLKRFICDSPSVECAARETVENLVKVLFNINQPPYQWIVSREKSLTRMS